MILRLYPSRLRGTVSVPPSKSLLHRELICRRLAGQTTALPPHPADDIRYTAAALAQLDIPAPTVYCGGSGSTLIACEQMNRRCFTMEFDPQYADVIIDRWQQFTGQEAKKLN